jgi:hypothetical protein
LLKRSRGFSGVARCLLSHEYAFKASWRKNSKTEPWYSVVPRFVTTLTAGPACAPYSAL